MVLITGATGNVAGLLIPALQEAGEQVRALVHDVSKSQHLESLGVEVVVGDMERPETLAKAVAGVGQIYLITPNGPVGARQARNIIAAAKPKSTEGMTMQQRNGR